MKRLLLIFVLALAACSDPELIVKQSAPVKHNGKTTSPMMVTCTFMNFGLDVQLTGGPYHYNDWIHTKFYSEPEPPWRVKPYFGIIMVRNKSTVNSIAYRRNNVTNFYLNPGESKPIIMQNTPCDCELTCPGVVDVQWDWSIIKISGSDPNTLVEMEFLSIQPSHTFIHSSSFVLFQP